jgi:hypothetical protein
MGENDRAPGSKTVAIKLNATDIEIPVFWQVGDRELGTYDCGPLVGYTVKGQHHTAGRRNLRSPTTFDAVTTAAGTITVGDKTINVCLSRLSRLASYHLQKRRHTSSTVSMGR